MPLNLYEHYDHSGGVNYTDPAEKLRDNELSGTRNTRIDGTALTERGGQTKLNSSAVQSGAAVHSLFRFYKDDGSTRYLIGFAGTRMLEMKASPGNWESSPTSFSSGTRMDGASINNTFFFGNGADGMKSTTAPGGSLTSVSGAPNAKFIESSPTANRLFASGVTASPKTVYYSAQGTGDDWTTANDSGAFDVPFTEGENVTAIAVMPNGVLAIFSNSSFHTLTGTDPGTFVRREIDPSIGCKAPRSIVPARGGIYFLANNNRFYWTNGGPPIPVSRNIDGLLMSGNTGSYTGAVAWAEGTRYHCGIPFTGSNNNLVVVKDWNVPNNNPQGGWVVDDSIAPASVAVDDGVNGQVYTGDYSGFVQQQDVGTTDNGTAVSAYWERDYTLGEVQRVKKVKRTRPRFEESGDYNATVSVGVDGGSLVTLGTTVDLDPGGAIWGAFTWGAATWGGGGTYANFRIPVIRRCRSIKIRYSISNPFKYFGQSIFYRLKYRK